MLKQRKIVIVQTVPLTKSSSFLCICHQINPHRVFIFIPMKNLILLVLLVAQVLPGSAQKAEHSAWSLGIELDALPYLTGGYFVAGWVGKDQLRLRALTANVNKPDWSTAEGFTKHHVQAYALVADYFLKSDWRGWWIGAGPVYWKSSIQSDLQLETARFENLLLNGSLGYNWKLMNHLYLSPWAGLSIRVAGDTDVPVDNKRFTLPLFNPEASLKVGLYF